MRTASLTSAGIALLLAFLPSAAFADGACEANPCVNGGCEELEEGYSCSCDSGWEGTNCDVEVDECAANPCLHGDCTDLFNGFSCSCDPGWSGLLCGSEFDPTLPFTSSATTVCRTETFDDDLGVMDFHFVGDANDGSAVVSSGRLQLTSDGTQLYHGTDNGGLVSQTVTGDFRAEVQLLGFPVNAGGGYRRSGLTVRSGTGPNDPRVYIEYLPHHPVYNKSALMFDYRGTSGTASELASTKLGLALPLHLAIDRRGDSFTAWYSSDGVNWIKPTGAAGGTIGFDMPDTTVVGPMSASYDSSITLTSEFDNFELCEPVAERLPSLPEAVTCDSGRPLDIVYLLDVSGGGTTFFGWDMSQLDAYRHAIGEINGFVDAALPGSRAALVAFRGGPAPAYTTGAGATVLSPFSSSLTDAESAANAINLLALNPSTSSPLAHGLDRARQLLVADGDSAHQPVVVVLSDGSTNVDFAGRGPQHYKNAELQILSILDDASYLSVPEVGWLGGFNGAISTWDGEPLADAMAQALALKNDVPNVIVESLGIFINADSRPDLLTFFSDFGSGHLTTAYDLDTLNQGAYTIFDNLDCSTVSACEPNPCGNGGTCFNQPEGFSCTCPPEWTGATCEEPAEGPGQ